MLGASLLKSARRFAPGCSAAPLQRARGYRGRVLARDVLSPRGVGAQGFEDLVAWQLCHQLKIEVLDFTASGPASRDFKYRDQIRDSSASAQSNVAEGFARFRPLDFARFLEYAKASLAETRDHLIDGHDRKYLSPELFSRLSNLSRTAERVTTSLLLAKKRQANRSRGHRNDLPEREQRTRKLKRRSP